MKGFYSKKLQKNSKLYQELQDNIKLYINHSIHKESKQKSYLQHTAFLNPKTGEYLNIDYDFEKKYKEYSRISEQRALTIQELAKRKEFCSVFITLTLHFLAYILSVFRFNLFNIIDLTISFLYTQSSSHICINLMELSKHLLVLSK